MSIFVLNKYHSNRHRS